MDPVTQGILGAIAAQTTGAKSQLAKACVIGTISGMAADLDILIQSSSDSLLALQYHRHFTHSLMFIPLGGLLCALILHPLLGKHWNLKFNQTLIWCWLGYATHALLDSCTSYGTKLWWPFSSASIAWDSISIIDPLFTLPLLALTLFAAFRKKRGFVIAAISWAVIYISIGFIQHQRAMNSGYQLAESRGHSVQRLHSKPSFGNLIVWKVIYESDGYYYVDAVKPGLGNSTLWQGSSIKKLDVNQDVPWLVQNSQQAKDIERFRRFSADFIALDPNNPNRIIDMRYSMLPHQIQPLWGIELSPDATNSQHVTFYSDRGDSKVALKQLWLMILQ